MEAGKKLKITETKDPEVFAECARLMSQSDPWTTLGLPYEYCIKAFEGGLREVFLAECENELAGFVIMQTQGTFKGYIQTIFMKALWLGMGLGKELIQIVENFHIGVSLTLINCSKPAVAHLAVGAEKYRGVKEEGKAWIVGRL